MGGQAGGGGRGRAALAAVAIFGAVAAGAFAPAAGAGDVSLERRFDAALAAGDVPAVEAAARDLCAAGAEGELTLASKLDGLWDRVTPHVVHVLAREAKDPNTFLAVVGAVVAAEGPRASLLEECPQAMALRLRDDPLWSTAIAARAGSLPPKESAIVYRCVGHAGGEAGRALLDRALESYRPEAMAILLAEAPAGSLADPRTLETLSLHARDPRTDMELRLGIVEALGRTGRAALPVLVAIHATAVEEAARDPGAARIARAARAILVHLAGGIDHGESGEAWRAALERDAFPADEPLAAAAPRPEEPFDLRVPTGAAALALGLLTFVSARRRHFRGAGMALAVAPVAIVLAGMSIAGRAPERRTGRPGDADSPPARALTAEARDELARRIWDYLGALRRGPVQPTPGISWVADEEVRSGRAFAPLAARFDDARAIALVDVRRDTARLLLRLGDGRVARGRLVYEFHGGGGPAQIVWFRHEGTLPMSPAEWRASTLEPSNEAPGTPAAAAPAPVSPAAGTASTALRLAMGVIALALTALALRSIAEGREVPAKRTTARPRSTGASGRPSLFRPELRRRDDSPPPVRTAGRRGAS